ncbi:hypothetical protein B0T16DRAFT_3187 [Cercophora newfieldiana]|uniref:Uncharacterized protein n=1 Tax=Cercophora newfieldiana TaxID=92897 RepID=A0AA39YLY7_9PEZI|nr:hypothetical protein B0T16DRAFT_3187 [Cercophora newfieldiana]
MPRDDQNEHCGMASTIPAPNPLVLPTADFGKLTPGHRGVHKAAKTSRKISLAGNPAVGHQAKCRLRFRFTSDSTPHRNRASPPHTPATTGHLRPPSTQ